MIKKIIQEAFVLKSNGYYKHAIEAFYKALELDGASNELFLEIADLYYLMGNEERALNYLEQILEKDTMHVDSLKLLKKIFLNKKAYDEARQTAENIYAISNDAKDLAGVLELLNMQKKYDEVLDYNADFEDVNIFYELSLAGLFSNKIDLAEMYVNKALDIEKNDKNLLLKSKILFKKNNVEEATRVFDEISYNPESSDYLNYAGIVKQYNCSFKDAISLFKEAIKLEPKNDEYYYNCASTYFKMNDISSAKKYYNLAISLAPDNPNYHFALANLYYSEKQYKRAFEELDYDFYEANLLKAIILYDTGYIALARKSLIELNKERPEDLLVAEYMEKVEAELKI